MVENSLEVDNYSKPLDYLDDYNYFKFVKYSKKFPSRCEAVMVIRISPSSFHWLSEPFRGA